MELGEKLRQARLDAGLSQRQLCGEEITRNMLSLIENGTANPSVKTLQYLAARLGKSISFFLEEADAVSPNHILMRKARQQFDAEDYAGAAETLKGFQSPDEIFQRERALLQALTYLELADQAIRENRMPYALELLSKAEVPQHYAGNIHRQKLLLLGQIPGQHVSRKLPSLDEELLLRAKEAWENGLPQRTAQLLDAAEDQNSPFWNCLRGEVWLREKQYHHAIRCFLAAEAALPKETIPKLEVCYRELGDFKMAYEYACKQK